MNKTIVIGTRGSLSNKASFWLFMIIGTGFFLTGANDIYLSGLSVESMGNMVFGGFFCAYAIVTYFATSYTPRIQIDSSTLELRNKVFGKTWQLDWSEIRSIEFRSFEIQFNLKDDVRVFSYGSNPETSMDIKKSIREMAENKDIEVIGG